MSMSEIMTCVRHDIPVTAVVFHNRQWGAEKKNQVDFYNRRFVAGELENESFAGIAQAMGAEGIVVDKLEDVGPALQARHRRADERTARPRSSRSCAPASWAIRSAATRSPSPCACSTSTRTTSEHPSVDRAGSLRVRVWTLRPSLSARRSRIHEVLPCRAVSGLSSKRIVLLLA